MPKNGEARWGTHRGNILGARTVVLLGAVIAAACSQPIRLDWKFDLGTGSVSTPLVTDGFIAVGSETGVSIIELDGSARCVFDAHGEVISAPKTDGKLIYFGSTNYIFYAIEPTCVESWKFPTRDRIKSDPLVIDGRVFVSSYDGNLYALDGTSGKRLWTFPDSAHPRLASAPAAPAPKKEPRRKKKNRKAVSPPEPEPDSKPEPTPPAPEPIQAGDFSYSSPTIHDGTIYLGNLDGYLYAINAEDGALKWRYQAGGSITSTPLITDAMLYVGCNDGNIYAIGLDSHTEIWKFNTKDWVNSSGSIKDGILYIGGNDRHIYAINASTGEGSWSFDTQGPAIARPTTYENLVIAAGGSGDGAVYAVDASDGSLFWKYVTDSKIESDPIVVGDHIYVSSSDGHLYAFVIEKTTTD